MTARIARTFSLSSLSRTSVAAAAALGVCGLSACRPPAGPSKASEPAGDVRAACEDEATDLAADPHNLETVIVVLDAPSGRILAMSGRRGRSSVPDLPATHAYDPGSVMKTFTYAAAIERGLLSEDARWDGTLADVYTRDGHPIHDTVVHGAMSSDDVLAFSSNVGSLQIFERVGPKAIVDELGALHFSEALDLGASRGAARLRTSVGSPSPFADFAHQSKIDIGLAAIGGYIVQSPVTIAAAFRAVTVDGVYRAPRFVGDGGEPTEASASPARVLRPESVALLRTYLEHTVSRDDGTGHLARVGTARIAGKTGTWSSDDDSRAHSATLPSLYANFVGAVPADAPRFVILVGVVTTTQSYGGGTIAAPAFARLATKLLAPPG